MGYFKVTPDTPEAIKRAFELNLITEETRDELLKKHKSKNKGGEKDV